MSLKSVRINLQSTCKEPIAYRNYLLVAVICTLPLVVGVEIIAVLKNNI